MHPLSCDGELFSHFPVVESLLFVLTFGLDPFIVSGHRVRVLLGLRPRVLLGLRYRVPLWLWYQLRRSYRRVAVMFLPP